MRTIAQCTINWYNPFVSSKTIEFSTIQKKRKYHLEIVTWKVFFQFTRVWCDCRLPLYFRSYLNQLNYLSCKTSLSLKWLITPLKELINLLKSLATCCRVWQILKGKTWKIFRRKHGNWDVWSGRENLIRVYLKRNQHVLCYNCLIKCRILWILDSQTRLATC